MRPLRQPGNAVPSTRIVLDLQYSCAFIAYAEGKALAVQLDWKIYDHAEKWPSAAADGHGNSSWNMPLKQAQKLVYRQPCRPDKSSARTHGKLFVLGN